MRLLCKKKKTGSTFLHTVVPKAFHGANFANFISMISMMRFDVLFIYIYSFICV